MAAGDDSLFVQVGVPAIRIHYKDSGPKEIGEKVFVLLHGFGASIFSWWKVRNEMEVYGRVVAYDRPAFGFSERPLQWEGEQSPYSMQSQVNQLIGLLDYLQIERVILVAHSAGGPIAFETALIHPERVSSIIGVAPAIYQSVGLSTFSKYILSSWIVSSMLTFVLRRFIGQLQRGLTKAWHDPQKLDIETIDGYMRPFQQENWDKALWEFTLASTKSCVPERLQEFETLPICIITGDDDQIVPTKQSKHLSAELVHSQLFILKSCGHLPQEEQPEDFLVAVGAFIHSTAK